MNTGIDVSAAMEQDATMAQSNGYGNDNWVSMSPYSQSPYENSPMNEYASFGQFMPHGLQTESINSMPLPHPSIQPPPNQAQQQHHHLPHHQLIQPAPPPMGHHQLPMLNTTWPSQLTNPTPTSSAGSYSAPSLSITPASSGPPPTPVPPSSAAPPPATSAKGTRSSQTVESSKQSSQPEKTPRKTLSAEQKRAMCQYHDENPGTRQADIGAKFGVERSTVSKVLRHRDQYLKREQDAEFAYKRAKVGKHPDFDRTLSNYIRRQQQRGFDVKDEEIMEQAKLFAHASGNQEGLLSTLTSSWLQKFKQKHRLGSGRLMRRASETNIPDSARMSTALPALNKGTTSSGISPTSPTQPLSPLSGSRSDEDLHKETLDFEFTYRAHGSQSNTSLASDARDNGASSFSTTSPAASFNFSPDPNVGAFAVDQAMHMHAVDPPPDFHHREKRSNTFPSINVNLVNHESSATEVVTAPMTPRHPPPVTSASSSAVQSPTTELRVAPFAINTSLTSPPPLRRTSSSSSITGRSSSTPVTGSAVSGTPVDSSPVSPTQEEARQAANTLLSYIQRMSQNGQFDHGEYIAVVQLTKKLQLHQHQSSRPSIGGLSRIPEGDHELPASAEATMEVR
ncbi:hypothetical protein TOPH_00650 [Tolypocladium ophioglossoides CBS 100239]|uniref:HTH CENPB-type domain-containing protein n=1 Tax=Tolypocladium ophioglossoides (strain CBS 100239) TaxID=1163406 RepID=A0A0L0NM15_TOLOC|nr:hypothetical protein TOPH_00650 [Tolypocladium ophioglossoides CBS 100239]